MKTKIVSLLVFLLSINLAFSQVITDNSLRYIEVTGSAERIVKPDVILYDICIQEYWKEEFEAGKDFKDYTTKITLEEIEKQVLVELSKLGITKEQISVIEGSNYSRINGKSFMYTKTIQLSIADFKKVNEILQKVNINGISYMRIVELKNNNIALLAKQLKVEAMKDAKDKATYLLESLGATVGSVLSVVEFDNNSMSNLSAEEMHNISTIVSSGINQNGAVNEHISLKCKFKVRFEIK